MADGRGAPAKTRRVNLALQGGGAHGAFTWGVLDRLLEEDDLEIAGISGTSAGALNGAALSEQRNTAVPPICSTVANCRDGCRSSMTSRITVSRSMPWAFIWSGICASTRGVST
jgi:hypothetical protein